MPNKAKFPTSPTITWSDGSTFDGFALIGIVPPTDGVTQWASVSLGDQFPQQRLPVFAKIPIVNGVFNSALGLFFTADIDPPNTKYVLWYYDTTGRQIAGPSALFTVTTDPLTLPALVLPVPIASAVVPTPD